MTRTRSPKALWPMLLVASAAFMVSCGESEAPPAPNASSTQAVTAEVPPCCPADADPEAGLAKLAAEVQKVAPAQASTAAPGSVTAESPAEPTAPVVPRSEVESTDSAGSALVDAKKPGSRASAWIEPADRVAFDLPFDVSDQTGRAHKLADLLDRPVAMAFIFTRCPTPTMCPLTSVTMADLERRVAEAGLSDKVRLLVLTYDPVYDTPPRLLAYGKERGFAFTSAMLLQPRPEQFRQLMTELQIGMSLTPTGEINHYIELLLADRKGRFVRDYQGDIWDNDNVLADLKRLAAE